METAMRFAQHFKIRIIILLAMSYSLATVAASVDSNPSDKKPSVSKASKKHTLDRSGKPRKGKASYYARKFQGRKMADGTPMTPQSNVAASKTLPLGTKAEVTNLENGKSAVVEIKDRGPYVDGRIVDLSPKTADKLDIKKEGVAPVEVKPIEVPQADGTTKPGAGANSTGAGVAGAGTTESGLDKSKR
jgi:rare lipoprotein A